MIARVRHVIPDGDRRRHLAMAACWCRPLVRVADDGCGYVCCHHSLDGREVRERFGEVVRAWMVIDRRADVSGGAYADARVEALALEEERARG